MQEVAQPLRDIVDMADSLQSMLQTVNQNVTMRVLENAHELQLAQQEYQQQKRAGEINVPRSCDLESDARAQPRVCDLLTRVCVCVPCVCVCAVLAQDAAAAGRRRYHPRPP